MSVKVRKRSEKKEKRAREQRKINTDEFESVFWSFLRLIKPNLRKKFTSWFFSNFFFDSVIQIQHTHQITALNYLITWLISSQLAFFLLSFLWFNLSIINLTRSSVRHILVKTKQKIDFSRVQRSFINSQHGHIHRVLEEFCQASSRASLNIKKFNFHATSALSSISRILKFETDDDDDQFHFILFHHFNNAGLRSFVAHLR